MHIMNTYMYKYTHLYKYTHTLAHARSIHAVVRTFDCLSFIKKKKTYMCRFVSFSICFDNVQQMEKRYKCIPVHGGKCAHMALGG